MPRAWALTFYFFPAATEVIYLCPSLKAEERASLAEGEGGSSSSKARGTDGRKEERPAKGTRARWDSTHYLSLEAAPLSLMKRLSGRSRGRWRRVILLLAALALLAVTTTEALDTVATTSAPREEVVVAGGLDGRVYALDAWTGNVLWTFDSGGPMVASSDCGHAPPKHQSHPTTATTRTSTTTTSDTSEEDLSIVKKASDPAAEALIASNKAAQALMTQLVPSYDGRLYHVHTSEITELDTTMADLINANGPVRLTDSSDQQADILLFGDKRTDVVMVDVMHGPLYPYSPTSPTQSETHRQLVFGRSAFQTKAVYAQNSSCARCFTITEYFMHFVKQSRCAVDQKSTLNSETDAATAFSPALVVQPTDEAKGSTITAYDPYSREPIWAFEMPEFEVLAVYGVSANRGSMFFKWQVDGPSSKSSASAVQRPQQIQSSRKREAIGIDSPDTSRPSVIIAGENTHGVVPSRRQVAVGSTDTGDNVSKQLAQPSQGSNEEPLEPRMRLRLLGDNYFLESNRNEATSGFRALAASHSSDSNFDDEHDDLDLDDDHFDHEHKRSKRRIFWEPIVNDGKRGVFITYYHAGAMLVGMTVGCMMIAWGCYVKGLSTSLAHSALQSIDNSPFFISHRLTIDRPGEDSITISSVINRALLTSGLTPQSVAMLQNGGDGDENTNIQLTIPLDPETEAALMEKFARVAALQAAAALMGMSYSSATSKLLELECSPTKSETTHGTLSSSASTLISDFSVSDSANSSFFISHEVYDADDLSVPSAQEWSMESERRGQRVTVYDDEDEQSNAFSEITSKSSNSSRSSDDSSRSVASSSSDSSITSDSKSSTSDDSGQQADDEDTTVQVEDGSAHQQRRASDASSSGSSTNSEVEVLFPFVCQSRFANEFEELSPLGKGGFGQVVLAENRLDGRKYAIKRVGLYLKHQTSATLQKFLREVKILALLDHPNIVRYYQAWLEKVEESPKYSGFSSSASDSEISASGVPVKNYSMSNLLAPITEVDFSANEPSFRASSFYSNGSMMDEEDDGGFEWERDSSPGEQPVWKEEDISRQRPRHEVVRPNRPSTVPRGSEDSSSYSSDKCDHWLFIQMQYCAGRNLGDFLAVPNRPMELSKLLKIFVQIASALAHVHSCGLIHRDLKPANIFVADTDGDSIKLGDFGLSRYAANVNMNAPSSTTTTTSEEHMQFSMTSVNSKSVAGGYAGMSTSRWSVSNVSESEVTAGVGTYLYASPEQVAGKKYNAKTDIYSLGMILFELCHDRFTTTMERYMALRDARESLFPENYRWHKRCPELMEMLGKLLSHDPMARPSAEEVVKWGQNLYETSLAQQMMAVIRSPVVSGSSFGHLPISTIDLHAASTHTSMFSLQVEAKMESCEGEGSVCDERQRLPNHNLLKEICDVIAEASEGHVEIKKCGLHFQDQGVQILEFELAPSQAALLVEPPMKQTRPQWIVAAIQALPGVHIVRTAGHTE